MIDNTTKKDFHNTLKYGESYVYIKKRIDILCDAVTTKLDGKYFVKYIKQHQLFIVSIYVSAWNKLPLYHIAHSDIGKNLFMTAHLFAEPYLDDSKKLFWNTTNCQTPGRAEYHISHIER